MRLREFVNLREDGGASGIGFMIGAGFKDVREFHTVVG
jgi:hypothetical protein